VIRVLRAQGLAIPVVIGGIIPDVDVPRLLDSGVAGVLTPGASADEVIDTIQVATEAET
jgi:methylmalonyl-CoA mutase cobalamin-binding domain/chain